MSNLKIKFILLWYTVVHRSLNRESENEISHFPCLRWQGRRRLERMTCGQHSWPRSRRKSWAERVASPLWWKKNCSHCPTGRTRTCQRGAVAPVPASVSTSWARRCRSCRAPRSLRRTFWNSEGHSPTKTLTCLPLGSRSRFVSSDSDIHLWPTISLPAATA